MRQEVSGLDRSSDEKSMTMSRRTCRPGTMRIFNLHFGAVVTVDRDWWVARGE